jgi:peptidoglycan/LPS O-acetylase OafA/YrhL
MNPGPRPHLPYLDGWRGLAIAFLMAGHFFPMRGINLGAVGVDLFFVLSGLLMGRILFVEQVPIRTFYRRRIARIFPPAYAFLALILLWYLARGESVRWRELAAAAGFVNNYVLHDGNGAPMPFGHFWSLCVEEHSYVVLSVVALAARARGMSAKAAIAVLLAAAAASGLQYMLNYQGPDLYHERWLRSEVSAFGILASAFVLLCLHGKRTRQVPGSVILLLGGCGVALHWWSVPLGVRTLAGVSALALAVNLLERAPGWVHAMLSLRWLRQLGVWSFSIYLWQQPFYLAASDGRLPASVGALAAVLAGIASFYLVEQPARAYLNRRWRGVKAASPAGTAAVRPCE